MAIGFSVCGGGFQEIVFCELVHDLSLHAIHGRQRALLVHGHDEVCKSLFHFLNKDGPCFAHSNEEIRVHWSLVVGAGDAKGFSELLVSLLDFALLVALEALEDVEVVRTTSHALHDLTLSLAWAENLGGQSAEHVGAGLVGMAWCLASVLA